MPSMTLQQIADRIEIDDLLTRYATALDAKNWHLCSSCFTRDAFIDDTAAGGEPSFSTRLHVVVRPLQV